VTGPLDEGKLVGALSGGSWRARVVAQTGSTNADLRAAAQCGEATAGQVLVAEYQSAGRGRLGRRWESAPGLGLTFSLLVDPAPVPPESWGWLPLLTGLAVAEAGRATAGVPLRVKWPNDVLADDGRKVAGILCERVEAPAGPLSIVGIGVNVGAGADQLPVPTAASLADLGAPNVDRIELLAAILTGFELRLRAWRAHRGDAGAAGLAHSYLAACSTLGGYVSITLPGGGRLSGKALRIDAAGALVVDTVDGERTVTAGDVAERHPQ
jgi:BirA family biotin operon repressor/biotin-[acetyl-CoA-carboxylase] ligase